MTRAYPVAVLGATGLVGQRLIALLAEHPLFRVTSVVASDRSAGRLYRDAVQWKLPQAIPAAVGALTVERLEATRIEPTVVFSALDASVADEFEAQLARDGKAVISNAKSHRMGADVPLLVPEINASHLALIEAQRRRLGSTGFIVTNPNCSVIGLALALAPLTGRARLSEVVVSTLQAASGAGYPGVPSLDLIDNVIPYIGGEEDKIETEPQKILGAARADRIEFASIAVSAHVHRVPVADGHTLAVSARFDRALTPSEAVEAFRAFEGVPQKLKLPSAPNPVVWVLDGDDRPQPRLDRLVGGGMAVAVGKVRACPVMGLKFELLSHNTVRGAAGGTLLIAELLAAEGYLQ